MCIIGRTYAPNNDPHPSVTIGPRVHAELQRRVRELEARFPKSMTPKDRRELVALRELLKLPQKEH